MKAAALLTVLYLAIAPGMNVAALLHAVKLCELFERKPIVVQHSCKHHPRPEPKPEPEDCPHTHDIGVERGVMPSMPAQAATVAAPGWELEVAFAPVALPAQANLIQPVERPPPDVPRVGVTLLLV